MSQLSPTDLGRKKRLIRKINEARSRAFKYLNDSTAQGERRYCYHMRQAFRLCRIHERQFGSVQFLPINPPLLPFAEPDYS